MIEPAFDELRTPYEPDTRLLDARSAGAKHPFPAGQRGYCGAMHPVAAAATRGAIGAMAMTGVRRVSVGLGLVEQTPPEELVENGTSGFGDGLGPERRGAVVELVHWTVGAAGGALFGALPEEVRRRRLSGPVYGLAILAVFDGLVQPLLDPPRPKRIPPGRRAALAADHVLYGLILGGLLPPRG